MSSRAYMAAFGTSCDLCGADIEIGEDIVKTDDGEWVHQQCWEDTADEDGWPL